MSAVTEKLLLSAMDDASSFLVHLFDHFSELGIRCESPIEAFFVQAITAKAVLSPLHDIVFSSVNLDDTPPGGKTLLGVQTQVYCGSRRIDVVLSACRESGLLDGGEKVSTSKIAVECDGFAYHHGNPVAAAKDKARDREISPHFDAVIRFTGSEINADPYSCALQALKVLESKL